MIITQFFAEVCHKSDIAGRQPREAKVRLVKIWVSSQDFGVTVTPQTTTIKAAAMNAAGWRVARAVHFVKREKGDEE